MKTDLLKDKTTEHLQRLLAQYRNERQTHSTLMQGLPLLARMEEEQFTRVERSTWNNLIEAIVFELYDRKASVDAGFRQKKTIFI